MIWIKFKRILKAGFVSFWRNGYVSLASVVVMTITLCVITALILVGAMLSSTLNSIKDKVDINVYFVTSAPESEILDLQKSIQTLPQVSSVEYTSSDQELQNFKDRHQNDALTLQALDELNDNPLGASLNIRAKDPSDYESIANFIQTQNTVSPDGTSIIERTNYGENKTAIDALTRIIRSSEKLGLAIAIFFILISVLVTFNTIRLAIYISREEIAVMKLVGASNTFIRGPFVTVGLMYGLLAGILTLIIFYPVTYYGGPLTYNLGTGLNVGAYYLSNFGEIFLVILGSGLVVGALSSFLAVKKYLKI